MAIIKLSAIATSGGNPALTDYLVGVSAANVDLKYTLTQVSAAIGLSVTSGKTLTASNSLTLAGTDGKTLTVSNSLTLAGTDGKTLTVSNSLTLAGTDGKTLTVSNSLTFAGTDSSTLNIGTGGTLGTAAYQNTGTSGATIPFLNVANTWSVGAQTILLAPASNTQIDGLILSDTTAAPSSGNHQYSPSLHFIGQGWKTTVTAGSQQVEWIIDLQPANATTVPINKLYFSANTNSAGVKRQMSLRYDVVTAANSGVYFGDAADGITSHLFSANDGGSNIGNASGNRFATCFLFTGLQGVADNFVIKIGASVDTLLTRGGAAATWQSGAADAASAVAQTIQAQSVVAGTSNTAGADWIHKGSRGTGTGVGGKLKFQTAPAGTTGTSQNAAADTLTLDGPGNVVCGNAAIATNATDGFLHIPSCAGTPTGVPTAYTGRVPMVYDTTNNKFYIYNGAWKGGTAPGAWS